ncbi:ABC transporter ATP-binding protein [Streptomyces sp. RB110-1]|uniref:ATP-binding cassette domain-containing protein n=1 Tax=unclassified Streptomyces TaxID=2593676 RepID=UPI001900F14F|nr:MULTISPECIES: ABC transporter ATP-binding protein [unclassified Streptomyces]MBK0373755.1 ABC transporter ATP-binding protein [Streptomyces sp. RB110-1]MBK0389877.1 ABC transporter ATP-binding protein [Streptomyces sp. RB110-2]
MSSSPDDAAGAPDAAHLSASEKLLFGGELAYDAGWTQHHHAWLKLSLKAMALSLPKQIAVAVRLAHQADHRALYTVAAGEIGRGVAQAASLVMVNSLLVELLSEGAMEERLRSAVPSIIAVGLLAVVGSVLASVSAAATAILEPKTQRVATERYLALVARVELEAVEDDDFHRLMDSAQYGADAARRLVVYCAAVVTAAISLVAAGGVLTVLHWALLPMLIAMAAPRAWSALAMARHRYASFHRFIQHVRASQLISRLLIDQQAAGEVRVHGVGPFLLKHFRGMALTSEREQTRLARIGVRITLGADAAAGLATLVTYTALGLLLWQGQMALAVAGTAVFAIRTGAASITDLVGRVTDVQGEALFVADLETLCEEAARRAIPTGGRDLPRTVEEIRFDKVAFTYPGADAPSLCEVDLVVPRGKTVALVGRNGSGKSTLVKLLCGLRAPDSGHVLWGGVSIAEADRAQVFDRVAMVAQDFYRWPFTARVNIGVGRPAAPMDDAALAPAAAYAGADEVVSSLPRGLDTLLARGYKGGHEISGGMWQKVGLGRARHRQGQILIVDEPTSALDPVAEQRVFDQIHRLSGEGQTTVLITHRLHSVRDADYIYVLDEGRVAEHGTFADLMDPATGTGAFREAYELQAAQFRAPSPAVPGQPGPGTDVAGATATAEGTASA